MKIAIESETLRWAAEVLTSQAIETESSEMAKQALNVLDTLMRAMEPQGAAKLCRAELEALASED